MLNLGMLEVNPEASEPRIVSMLNYLKQPQASILAEKRKINVLYTMCDILFCCKVHYDYLRKFRKICGENREEMCGERKEI